MAPKNKWIVDTVAGATPSKKEEKLGDSIEIIGPHGGKQTLHRANVPDIPDERWAELKIQAAQDARPAPPPVPEDTPAPIRNYSDEEKAPVRVIDPVVAPNGATQSQVQEGGTPGTFKETPVLDTVENAANAVGSVTPDILKLDKGGPIPALGDAVTKPGPANRVPVDAETPPASAASAPGSEGGSASVSIRTPGGDPGMPAYDGPSSKEIMALGEQRGEAEAKKARVAAFAEGQKAIALREVRQAQLDMQETQNNIAADALEREAVEQSRLKEFENHFAELKAQQSKLDPTIDPNRYWKNKDAGQVALGAIAGALFGFAGKGMDYLNTIQNEVRMDIDAQKATYENASSKIRQQMADAGDEYARAKNRGLSDREARAAASAAKLSGMKSYIEATMTNTASVEAQGKAMEALAGIDSLNVAALQDAGKAATEAATRKGADWANKQSARAAMINANANVARLSASGGKDKLPGGVQTKIASAKKALDTLDEMKKMSSGGFWDKAIRTTASALPLTGLTEDGRALKADNKSYEGFKETLGRLLADSALQEKEAQRILANIPDRNSPLEDQQRYFSRVMGIIQKNVLNLESGKGSADEPSGEGE